MRVSLILTLLSALFVRSATSELPCPDFKSSMLLVSEQNPPDEHYLKNLELYDSLDKWYVDLFQSIYEKNIRIANRDRSQKDRIPRIIHQIWLGSKLPEKYRLWMNTWANLEGWEYRLWTDEDVEELDLRNKDLYDTVQNYGEKSDILRLEILEKFGGVYVDIDYECLQPEMIEEFHRKFDFYMGFEPMDHGIINKFRLFKVCNAIMGSHAHHPLLRDLIENLKANYYAYLNTYVIQRTGPSYLMRIICQYEARHAHTQRNIYLPCSFLYPICFRYKDYHRCHPREILKSFPEAAGIHYWEGSWTRPNTDCAYNFHTAQLRRIFQ